MSTSVSGKTKGPIDFLDFPFPLQKRQHLLKRLILKRTAMKAWIWPNDFAYHVEQRCLLHWLFS